MSTPAINFTTNALFSAALETSNISLITAIPHYMFSEFEVPIIKWIREFSKNYGTTPSSELVHKQFPLYRLEKNDGVPPKFIFDVVSARLQKEYVTTFYRELEQSGGDYRQLENVEKLNKLLRIKKPTVTRFSEINWVEYANKTTETMTYGIQFLDDVCAKLGKTDITYIAARLGSGKTTFLMFLLKLQYIMGKKLLVFSNEIDTDSLIQSIASIILQFDKKQFRLGLTEEERNLVKDIRNKVNRLKGDIIFAGAYNSIQDLQPFLESDDKPDIVFIDALNLAKGSRGTTQSDRLASIGDLNSDLRQFTNEHKIPVIATIQLNRSAAKDETPDSSKIAGSEEYGRIADCVISLSLTEFNGAKCTFIHVMKARNNRDGAGSGAYCFINSTNKLSIRRLTDDETKDALQEINEDPFKEAVYNEETVNS